MRNTASTIRAIFLYGVLLATLIPITQNALALIDRTLISASGLDPYRAILGGSQTWVDNLIAILMNALAAAYFINVLRKDWATLSDTETFADIRRVYRYLWLLYSLLMVIFGVQQILQFVLYTSPVLLGTASRDLFINGLSLLLVGAPIWYFSWKTCQNALLQKGERDSLLRLGVLFLLTLGGMAVVLSSSGRVLEICPALDAGRVHDHLRFRLTHQRPALCRLASGNRLGLLWPLVASRHQHIWRRTPSLRI